MHFLLLLRLLSIISKWLPQQILRVIWWWSRFSYCGRHPVDTAEWQQAGKGNPGDWHLASRCRSQSRRLCSPLTKCGEASSYREDSHSSFTGSKTMLSKQQHAGKAFTQSEWFFFTVLNQEFCSSVQPCKPVCSAVSEKACTDSVRPRLFPGTAASTGSSRETVGPGAGSEQQPGGSITAGSSPEQRKCPQAPAAGDKGTLAWTTHIPQPVTPQRTLCAEQLVACQKFSAEGIFYRGGFHHSWFSRSRTTQSFLPLSSRG